MAASTVDSALPSTFRVILNRGPHGNDPDRATPRGVEQGQARRTESAVQAFKLKEIWAIRVRLQMQGRLRELALFDLGIDSKLRACDLVKLRVRDVCHGDRVAPRAIVLQYKTQRLVQFEITPPTRDAIKAWIKRAGLKSESFLFPSCVHASPHLSTRQSGSNSSVTSALPLLFK